MKTIKDYKLLAPGEYNPSTGKLIVTDADVKDFVDAINLKAMVDVPTAIVYDHRGKAKAIPVGTMVSATYRDGNAYGNMSLEMDAQEDGKTLATIDQMQVGLQNKILQGSMEAYRNYKSKAYTGARKFGLWPTAWAILPAGVQPAVPPNIAASEGADEIVWLTLNEAPEEGKSPNRKGAEMTLEELGKLVEANADAIAEVVNGLKVKASDDSKTEKAAEVIAAEAAAQVAVEAAEEAVVIAMEPMVARKPEGVREKVTDFVNAGETPADKIARIKTIDSLVPDLVLPAGSTLEAGESDPDTGDKTDGDKIVDKAKKMAKEKKISMNEALEEIRAEEEEAE